MKNSKAEPEVSNQSSVQSKHCLTQFISHQCCEVDKEMVSVWERLIKKTWFEC